MLTVPVPASVPVAIKSVGYTLPAPLPIPVATNIVPMLLSGAPHRVKSVVTGSKIMYCFPVIIKLPGFGRVPKSTTEAPILVQFVVPNVRILYSFPISSSSEPIFAVNGSPLPFDLVL